MRTRERTFPPATPPTNPCPLNHPLRAQRRHILRPEIEELVEHRVRVLSNGGWGAAVFDGGLGKLDRVADQIAAAAGRLGKPVGVCGELAGTPLGAIALIGCGFRTFSMSAARIAQIKRLIRALDMSVVEARIQALAHHPAGSVRGAIADLARQLGADVA